MPTYTTKLAEQGSSPQIIVVLTLDACAEVYGVAPCTASETGDNKCFNELFRCDDTANYNLITRDFKFCFQSGQLPIPGVVIRPYLQKISYIPTVLDFKKSLTEHARGTAIFIDSLDNDAGIDPYASDRSAYPNALGQFFKKLFIRNVYYENRPFVIKLGYLGLTEAQYVSRGYIINKVEFEDNGMVKIIFKDNLKKLSDVLIPEESSMSCINSISDSVLSIIYSGADIVPTIESWKGYIVVRIDDEYIKVDSIDESAQVLNVASNGRGFSIGDISTTAASHAVGAKIQPVFDVVAENGVDLCKRIIEDKAGMVAGTEFDENSFDNNRDDWFTGWEFTGVVDEPTPADKILFELTENLGANIFHDEEDRLIKFQPQATDFATIFTIWDDSSKLVKVKAKNNEISRVSKVIIYHNKKALDDIKKHESYARQTAVPDQYSGEDSNRYGSAKPRIIYSRWASDFTPLVLAHAILRRFENPAKELSVIVGAESSGKKVGEFVEVQTDLVPDELGASDTDVIYQIASKKQLNLNTFQYEVMAVGWGGNYRKIGPTSLTTDYDSSSAVNQLAYMFVADTNDFLGAANDSAHQIF